MHLAKSENSKSEKENVARSTDSGGLTTSITNRITGPNASKVRVTRTDLKAPDTPCDADIFMLVKEMT